MIIPQHWAEASSQHKAKGRQVTVHRFGWSDTSLEEAQAMAQARADEALQQVLSGEPLDHREKKTAYNGADGMPIREEVLSRHGDTVITRNSYGARCLNTPDVLFADVDFPLAASGRAVVASFVALLLVALVAGWLTGSGLVAVGGAIAALLLASLTASRITALRGGPEALARRRVVDFLAGHPGWSVRVYRTPAGLRLAATHRTYAADEPEVQTFFEAIAADPVYVRMCLNQKCFRARLSAKPWRIGIASHMRPRPGLWPVHPDRLPLRQAWVAQYEARAGQYAACRYVEQLGSGAEHIDVMPVIALHDRESRALDSGVAIA